MSDVQDAAPSSTEPVAADNSPAVDPAAPYVPQPVTHESLLSEFVSAVRRDARGISNHLESLLEKAAKHFGL